MLLGSKAVVFYALFQGEQEAGMQKEVLKEPTYVEELLTLFRSNLGKEELLEKISDYHESDIADAMEQMTPEERKKLYPLLGEEYIAEILSYTEDAAEYLQEIFMSPVFRVYTNPDILGVELGGSLKNVIALAAGAADGLGYGDNTKAALITRGIAEITRLGVAMGAKVETFNGLTGIGDLIVTCASRHSRNRKAGYLIGQGYTMDEAMKEVKMVVEGVYSAKAAMELAVKYEVEMPIVEQVNKVLFENKSAKEAVAELMLRDKKVENSTLVWEA